MPGGRGSTLLLLFLLVPLAFHQGRRVLSSAENPPPFFTESKTEILVELAAGFDRSGVYQFSDGTTPKDVIKLTDVFWSSETSALLAPLHSGEALSITLDHGEVAEVHRFWMAAAKRMALGVPLHPDRMSLLDWESLPGIGPKLAAEIENDRQKNGDFIDFYNLLRVKGIGKRRLQAWEKYF